MAGEFDTDDPRYTALYIGEVVSKDVTRRGFVDHVEVFRQL